MALWIKMTGFVNLRSNSTQKFTPLKKGVNSIKISIKYSGSRHMFDNTGDTLTATHTGGDNAIFFIQPVHVVQ